VGLERDPLGLVRITEELLVLKVAAPVYKTEINGRGDLRVTLYPQRLALTSSAGGGGSVDTVRLGTESHRICLFYLLSTHGYCVSLICLHSNCIPYVTKKPNFVCLLDV
jgi:hypothetical protein